MLDTHKDRMDFRSLDRAVESGSFDPKLTPPRLPVYSLAKKPDPLGMTTPPVGPQGAVPFQWEQAPGKPKSEAKPEPPRRNRSSSAAANTRLGLPPKMAASAAAAKEKRFSKTTPASHAFSPSSMRDALRQRSASLSSLSSLVKGRNFSSSLAKGRHSSAKDVDDGSFLKGRSIAKERKEWREDKGEDMTISPCYSASSSQSSSSLTFSSCTGGEESEEEREKEETKEVAVKVRITRYERERTLTCHTATDFWTKISGRLQAAVPWRRDIKM
ncbi:uncharacterized protein M6B38_302260 [Iris pallida]|uniref:Uncharacterized protein n=1 Tax=Iris pallida TaxID=29817 RepID=A0AAX6HME3_IRIPA|nr:uncharacterized protein M6B38_302260 [Iris pallida]